MLEYKAYYESSLRGFQAKKKKYLNVNSVVLAQNKVRNAMQTKKDAKIQFVMIIPDGFMIEAGGEKTAQEEKTS